MPVGRRRAIVHLTDDFRKSSEALPPGERNRSFSGRSPLRSSSRLLATRFEQIIQRNEA